MALINCPECSSEVSDTAFKCPKCAFEIKKAERSYLGALIKKVFIGFNIFMFIILIVAITSDPSSGMDSHRYGGIDEAKKSFATGMNVGVTFFFWGLGDIVLGLFVLLTRPKS